MADTTVTISLVIKGDSVEANTEIVRRLYPALTGWFAEEPFQPPFPVGSLLWYGVTTKLPVSPEPYEIEDEKATGP